MILFFFLVAISASTLGALCGIGGGVLMKPVLDSFHLFPASTISFLSSCTVLSMSAYSACRVLRTQRANIHLPTMLPLAIGASLGGVVGKTLFAVIQNQFNNQAMLGIIQSSLLLLTTILTLLYTVFKGKIATQHIKSKLVSCFVGLILGLIGAFLGIGGGPINLMVLSYFFSMPTKKAAQNSLFIIMCSQLASILMSVTTGTVPSFDIGILIVMLIGGIAGGLLGRFLMQRLHSNVVTKAYLIALVLICGLCLYNMSTNLQLIR